MKRMILILIAIICIVLEVGCGQDVSLKRQEQIELGEYQDFETPTAEQLSNGKANVYVILKSYGSSYWETLLQGCLDAAKQADCNIYVGRTPKESQTAELSELIRHALAANPDAIVLSPADAPEIHDLVDEITERGIPLVFVDTILNARNFDICYMTDNMQAGRMAAMEMLVKLENNGHEESERLYVGIEIGSTKSQTIIERLAGFNEYWSDHAPKEWKIIDDIKCNDGDIDLAQKDSNEFMVKNVKLAGLIGLNNGSTVGICRSVLEAGRRDLVVVGFDFSEEIQQLIADESYCATTILQNQYQMGYGGVESALAILAGKEVTMRYHDTGVKRIDHL